MDDLVKTIKAQLYDRLSSPLVFSFCLAWLIWNYRVIVILLSSLSPSDKFLAIDLLPLSWDLDLWYWAIHLAIGPMITTGLYIFILPRIEKIVFEFSLKQRKTLKESRQRIEDSTPITEEEARELRAAAENSYREYRSTVKDREEEIARLKVELRETRLTLEEARGVALPQDQGSQPTDQIKLLTDAQDALLRFMSEMENSLGYSLPDDIQRSLGGNKTKLQYDLDTLERTKYVQKKIAHTHAGLTEKYTLTPIGRAYIIEHMSVENQASSPTQLVA